MPTRAAGLVLVIISVIGCKSGSNSANSPTSPSNSSNVQGGWTGTLTRPNGLLSISLKWEAQIVSGANSDYLAGPITFTGTGASVTSRGEGQSGGNDEIGYKMYFAVQEATPPSSCKIIGYPSSAEPYVAPYTTITVSAFNITYVADCRGLFDGATQQTNLSETVRLVLTKQ